MKSDELRAIDAASVPRPWRWTDGKLLWNEEADHCVLEHGGPSWPVSAKDRAAIESGMNHMPALVALVAACERRRLAIDERNEFGARTYREDPYRITTPEFREHAAALDRAIGGAEREVDAALLAVHAVVAPSSIDDARVRCAGPGCARTERREELTFWTTSWKETVHGWLCDECQLFPPPVAASPVAAPPVAAPPVAAPPVAAPPVAAPLVAASLVDRGIRAGDAVTSLGGAPIAVRAWPGEYVIGLADRDVASGDGVEFRRVRFRVGDRPRTPPADWCHPPGTCHAGCPPLPLDEPADRPG